MARRPRATKVASSRVYHDFEKRLAAGWPPGLTTLTGDDVYYLDMAQNRLIEALVPEDESSSFALTVFGDEKVSLSTVIQAARSVGMFSPQRVVLVREIAALEGEAEPLKQYAADAPRGSYLVVRAPALDRRRKLHKALLERGEALVFAAAEGFDPSRWVADVTAIAADKAVRLDRQAAALLAQLCAGDLYRVASELEKIRAWLGKASRVVDARTVQQVAASGGMMSGWEVADALLIRDRAGALAAARRLVEGGEEPIRIVGGLAFRARVLLQAKAMQSDGTPMDRIVSATRAWAYKEGLSRGLAAYTLEELRGFPSLLLAADRTLKSRAIDSRSVLETLVERMTAPATRRATGAAQ